MSTKITTRKQETMEFWAAGQLAPALAELASLLASGELMEFKVEHVFTELTNHKGWSVHAVLAPSASRSEL